VTANQEHPIRELFIEELEEVTGGTDPRKKLQWLIDQLQTTYSCGEEVTPC
jgi:hypothetical protein